MYSPVLNHSCDYLIGDDTSVDLSIYSTVCGCVCVCDTEDDPLDLQYCQPGMQDYAVSSCWAGYCGYPPARYVLGLFV